MFFECFFQCVGSLFGVFLRAVVPLFVGAFLVLESLSNGSRWPVVSSLGFFP